MKNQKSVEDDIRLHLKVDDSGSNFSLGQR